MEYNTTYWRLCEMSMRIVEEKEYRSEGRKVNQSYDMVRVTIDMTKNDYYKLLTYVKQEERDE